MAAVAVGVLMELGVTDPVPALHAPPVSHQLQQGFGDAVHPPGSAQPQAPAPQAAA